jgi:tetratricopeptide (TPR) repeat protein
MSTASRSAFATPTRGSIAGLVLIVALVIAALTAVDLVLEQAAQAELNTQAQTAHTAGVLLLQQGKASQAVDLLRKAQALERANSLYELDLIKALIAAGKVAEAEPLMNEILLREPNDGAANLVAARLMVKRDKKTDAAFYYHRAIYGEWLDNAPAHRIAARMELIRLLISEGKHKELLAELLPLQEEAGTDQNLQKTIAHLFLVSGSPGRSAEAYHAVIEKNPKDFEAYAGLGEAELEQGRYRNAHAAFLTAYYDKPDNPAIRPKMELSRTLTELDPTSRRLPTMEKYNRSLHILQLVYADFTACSAKQAKPMPDETRTLLAADEAALAKQNPAHVTNEVSEGVLGLAEKTWQARIETCGANTSPDEETLRLIVEKLAQ